MKLLKDMSSFSHSMSALKNTHYEYELWTVPIRDKEKHKASGILRYEVTLRVNWMESADRRTLIKAIQKGRYFNWTRFTLERAH